MSQLLVKGPRKRDVPQNKEQGLTWRLVRGEAQLVLCSKKRLLRMQTSPTLVRKRCDHGCISVEDPALEK